MTKDDIREIIKCLPCSDACFEGGKNWNTGHCLADNKCEYINGMGLFIANVYPDYSIVKCLDVDRKDLPQPEALLRNRSGQYMAIEMKNIPEPQFLESSVKETEKKNEFDCSFWKGSIDGSTHKAKTEFTQRIKKTYPNISSEGLEAIINIFFRGMKITLIPIEKNISVRDLVHRKRKEFEPFLVNEMVSYSIGFLEKFKLNILQDEDFNKVIIFNNELELYFAKTLDQTVYVQIHDTKPFSLCNHIKINEEGVTDFLKKFVNSCDRKFMELNKETSTEKNILLLTHGSTLSEATNVIATCLEKIAVPKSIHEIWVTDYQYESVYDDDGDEIGEQITEYKYRKLFPR